MQLERMAAFFSVLIMGTALASAQDIVLGGQGLEVPAAATMPAAGTGGPVVVPASAKEGLAAKAKFGALPPGRYAVEFRLGAPAFGRTGATRILCQVQPSGLPSQTRSLRYPDLPQDASPRVVPFVVVLPKQADLVCSVNWADNQDRVVLYPTNNTLEKTREILTGTEDKTAEGSGEIIKDLPAIHIYDIAVHRLDGGVGVVKVFPDKLLYRRGEKGSVAVTLHNFSDRDLSGTLALTLVRDLGAVRSAGEKDVTVPAGQDVTVAMPFACGQDQYGHEARVEWRQGGKVMDANSDVFNVCDSVWPVGMGGPTTMTGHSGMTDPRGIPAGVLQLRADYVNWWEKIFWPPDDWGDMTPDSMEWISGQSARWENATNIMAMVAACKPHGIKSITYGKHVAMNNEGWELVRRHPDWFYKDDKGRPRGSFHTFDMFHWNDFPFHMVNGKFSHSTFIDPGGWWVSPDFRNTEPLEHGIRELIESARRFGWDGVRFDGHWTAGNDELSTANMRRLKEALWKANPDFLFGFNYSWSYGHQTSHLNQLGMVSFNHEFRESMAGGGMYMQEAIGQRYGFSGSGSYSSWRDYAVKEVAAANGLRETGGSYHFIYGTCPYYKFALGTAAGAHPAYGGLRNVPGCENWGRFLTRWSGLVWDLNLKSLAAEGAVEVQSTEPLWWPEWVKERVVDAKVRQVIVHLINPPVNDEIGGPDMGMPKPATNVTVRIKVPARQTLRQAVLLDPMTETPVPLPVQVKGGWGTVTVPAVYGWSMVVAEFDGRFKLPEARPTFTEPPDPVKVAEGRGRSSGPAQMDPMRPGVTGLKPNQLLFETDSGFNSVVAKGVPDPDALNGMAQVRDAGVKGAGMGRSWIGPLTPGKWRAKLRVKLEDKSAVPHPQSLNIRMLCDKAFDYNVRFATAEAKLPKERTLISDNAYHEYEIPFELKKTSWPSLLGGASTPDEGDHRLLLDHIVMEQDEAYTDEVMLKENPLPVPAGLTIGGEPGLDVLVVKGWTWQTYAVDKVLPPTGGVIRVSELWSRDGEAEKFPQTHADLFKYDVVVLVNIGASGMGYEGRKVLKDFVEAGGGLVVLGGLYTLGQGDMKNTFLESLIPVELGGLDVTRAEAPKPLKAVDSSALARVVSPDLWKRGPVLYYHHAAPPKTGAVVHALAGDGPVLVSRKAGKGTVVVFIGTVLGEGKGDLPFWQWEGWPLLFRGMIDEAAGIGAVKGSL